MNGAPQIIDTADTAKSKQGSAILTAMTSKETFANGGFVQLEAMVA